MYQRLIEFIQHYKGLVIILSFLLVLFVGIADFFTGYEFGFSMFYLIPVLIATWSVGAFGGVVIAILSALSWTVAHSFSGLSYSRPFIPYWNFIIRIIYFLAVVITVDQLQKALHRERELARTDSLTGIANTKYFRERAHVEIEKCKRHQRPLTFAYIDCDNFKSINDSFGHKQGDALLQLVARIIERNIRSIDLVGRFGGDEFVIMLPESGDDSARGVITRLQKLLLNAISNGKYSISFSIGVATFESILRSLDDMIHRADELMYEAKKSGKNNIQYKVFKEIS